MNVLAGYSAEIFVEEHGTGWIQSSDFLARTRNWLDTEGMFGLEHGTGWIPCRDFPIRTWNWLDTVQRFSY